jgi:hypothetical protein
MAKQKPAKKLTKKQQEFQRVESLVQTLNWPELPKGLRAAYSYSEGIIITDKHYQEHYVEIPEWLQSAIEVAIDVRVSQRERNIKDRLSLTIDTL